MAKACSLVALLSLSIFTDHTNVAYLASAQEVNDCDNIDLPLKLSLLGSDVLLKTMDIDFEDTFNLVVGGSIDDAGTLKPFLGFYDSNNSYAPIFERTIAYDGETEIVFVNFSEDRSYIGFFFNGDTAFRNTNWGIINRADDSVQVWQIREENANSYNGINSLNFASFVNIENLFFALHSTDFDIEPRIDFLRVSMVGNGSIAWHKRTQPATGNDIPFKGSAAVVTTDKQVPPVSVYASGWIYDTATFDRGIWVIEFPASGDPVTRAFQFEWT